jgi:hypothetical protein
MEMENGTPANAILVTNELDAQAAGDVSGGLGSLMTALEIGERIIHAGCTSAGTCNDNSWPEASASPFQYGA